MDQDRSPTDLGSRLRAARERKGVPLRDIANRTKISVSVLEALERNDISRMPGGIFGRAFVRSYAIEIGLEPEEVIEQFLAQFPQESVAAGHPRSDQIEDNEALESDRQLALTFMRLGALSVPIVVALLYFGPGGHRLVPQRASPAVEAVPPTPAPATTAVEPAAAQEIEPAVSPASESAPTGATPADAAQAVDRLAVSISATRDCWVTATVDGASALRETLHAGDERTLEVRRELVLSAGDAAAIALRINGAPARPLGKDGEVVTTRMNLTNYQQFLATP